MFKLSVSQIVTFPRSKKSQWDRDNMPIAHPYITATVYLDSNPLAKYKDHDIIKSKCDKIFCSYNRKKYDHLFYLYYDEEGTRWSKTIASIKKGNIKVHISGFYMGYSPKEDNNSLLFHAIQLTELDFESKIIKYKDDDDDEFFFGSSTKTSKSLNQNKKHQILSSSEAESLDNSITSNNSTENNKNYKKKTKRSKSKATAESAKLIQSLSYDDFSANEAIQHLNIKDNSNDSLVTHENLQSQDEEKKSVKFVLVNEE